MDIETIAPIDDLEALFADEDEDQLVAIVPGNPSNNPTAC